MNINAGDHRQAPQGLSGRILLAEDGLDNQRLIGTILRRQGLDVDVTGDGEQAVAKALEALAEGQPYDLILMDMHMPRLDGYGATARLRREGYSGPVVALTAHNVTGERERCIAAGCNDFLAKSVGRTALLTAVRTYLQQGGRPRPMTPPEPEPESSTTGAVIHSSYADDPDMRELIAGFIERLPVLIQDIQAAHSAQDRERLTRLAHQLKGSAGGYGFLPVSQAAATLEKAVRETAPPQELDAALKALQQIGERVAPKDRG